MKESVKLSMIKDKCKTKSNELRKSGQPKLLQSPSKSAIWLCKRRIKCPANTLMLWCNRWGPSRYVCGQWFNDCHGAEHSREVSWCKVLGRDDSKEHANSIYVYLERSYFNKSWPDWSHLELQPSIPGKSRQVTQMKLIILIRHDWKEKFLIFTLIILILNSNLKLCSERMPEIAALSFVLISNNKLHYSN